MKVPKAFREEYETFLQESGFDNQDPQALLMELASLSMEVYLKEIAWLSEFVGKIEKAKQAAA
ncbi:MAG: hypothetical protein JJ866_03750 [Roseibium sp.]|uniref:hypothetical protein n=1 Tax=Roseibium sp. TaxID=1936156 RepID=UPI001B257B87|nr:hypothetical protein [Roseibium sp.]MBO6891034.1 hypothetical protein [Roseibium sp.]MBO6932849.1 hypothetical protein [Roseibium sp.]